MIILYDFNFIIWFTNWLGHACNSVVQWCYDKRGFVQTNAYIPQPMDGLTKYDTILKGMYNIDNRLQNYKQIIIRKLTGCEIG